MTAQEIKRHLLMLSASEQLEVMQVLLKTVSPPTRGIAKVLDVMGGEACICGTRIPVWLLVSYRQAGMSDSQSLEGYPDITAAELVEVWAYAKANPTEIDAAIKAQDEAELDWLETA